MEVHHHAHSIPDNHRNSSKKKWAHYFWEFLMLFLAVFCGFLAEYQLEHVIEKNRAKQYIVSLYEDLKTDTSRINDMLLYDDDKINALGDMEACYDSISSNPLSKCVETLILHSRANRSFKITDRTLAQLANAGGFRLLKKEDADSILSYVNMYKNYEDFQATIFQSSQDNVRNTLNELASFKSIKPLLQIAGSSYGTTTSAITNDMSLNGPLLFSKDPHLLNKWFNQLSVYLRITTRQRHQLAEMKTKVSGLIAFYKNKYRLD